MNKQLVEDLQGVRKLLVENGWCQGNYELYPRDAGVPEDNEEVSGGNPHCLVGAIRKHVQGKCYPPKFRSPEETRCDSVKNALSLHISQHNDGLSPANLMSYNDDTRTTYEDVLELLDAAIAVEESTVVH